ncbi:hypothetical protein KA405_06425 [Patescibacteria group bacterium]|nr:hypothetical protein [Patescibacteria group bacterium]
MSINKPHQEEIQNKNNIKKTQESALNSLLTAPAQVNKTLFTEFIVSPKKAWFHVNDKVVYEAIQVQEY